MRALDYINRNDQRKVFRLEENVGKWSGRTISLIGSTDKSLGAEWKNDCLDYYNEMNNQVPPIWTISRHKKRVDLHEIHKIEYSNREHGQVLETDLNSHVVIFIARCDWHENINKNSIASHLNLVIDTINTIINVIQNK